MADKDKTPNIDGRMSMDASYVHGELEWERQDKMKWIGKYYKVEKEKAVLESQKNTFTIWGVIFNFLLAIAGALITINFGFNSTTVLAILLFLVAFWGSIHNLRK